MFAIQHEKLNSGGLWDTNGSRSSAIAVGTCIQQPARSYMSVAEDVLVANTLLPL